MKNNNHDVQKGVRISAELAGLLRLMAMAEGVTEGEIIRRALRERADRAPVSAIDEIDRAIAGADEAAARALEAETALLRAMARLRETLTIEDERRARPMAYSGRGKPIAAEVAEPER